MRDIAALVFGGEPEDARGSRGLGKLFAPEHEHICDGIDIRTSEWCRTPPGHAALSLFGIMLGARRATRAGSHR